MKALMIVLVLTGVAASILLYQAFPADEVSAGGYPNA